VLLVRPEPPVLRVRQVLLARRATRVLQVLRDLEVRPVQPAHRVPPV
jgi:hypothetical protein